MNKPTIYELKEDTLVKIFSYFSNYEILKLKCVCCLWLKILNKTKTYPNFKVWNPYLQLKKGVHMRKVLLETCKRGNLKGFKYVSNFIISNIKNIKFNFCEVWGECLTLSSKYNHPELVKLISSYGINVEDKILAVKYAIKYKNILVETILYENFTFTYSDLLKINN